MGTRSFTLVRENPEIGDGVMLALYCGLDGYPEGLGREICDALDGSHGSTSDLAKDILGHGNLGSMFETVMPPDFPVTDPDFMKKLNSWVSDAEYLYIVEEERGEPRITVVKTDWGPFIEGKGLTTWVTDTLIEPEILYRGDIPGMRERFGLHDDAIQKP